MSYYAAAALPWTVSAEDEERFQKILRRILIFFVLLSLIMPFLPLPKVDREAIEELPPRIAKLMLEQHVAPAPPPVKLSEPEAVMSKPEPAKVKPSEVMPEKIKPPAPTEKKIENARKKASRSGLLAFKDELAGMRDVSVTVNLPKNLKPGPGVGPGKGPGVGSTSGPALGAGARAIITAGATTGSGGINTSKLSYGTGGGGLAGRSTTKVNSPIGGGGDGGAGGRLFRGGGGQAARSIEEIKLIFDKNKAAIYTLYNRALREDPSLQGKVILKLTIAPSGKVMDCEIVSSDLHARDLERKLMARVRLFDFGEKPVGVMVVTYPIDFLPS